ncbi:MAG: hypothetical protein KH297_04635 [Firmicutes bacterium]|nr:hypothetical protein [Bacillota bacterium]
MDIRKRYGRVILIFSAVIMIMCMPLKANAQSTVPAYISVPATYDETVEQNQPPKTSDEETIWFYLYVAVIASMASIRLNSERRK